MQNSSDPHRSHRPRGWRGAPGRPLQMPAVDWPEVARLLLTSRALDQLEEDELLPAGKVRYQFSARGHELAQILLGLSLDHAHDAATVYYRSRPFMLAAGLTAEEALCSTMARVGSINGGRDIGTVFNMPVARAGDCAADDRRCRRAVHAGGRLGADDPLSPECAGRGRAGRARWLWRWAAMARPLRRASGRR